MRMRMSIGARCINGSSVEVLRRSGRGGGHPKDICITVGGAIDKN